LSVKEIFNNSGASKATQATQEYTFKAFETLKKNEYRS
jgi:hypothetical protein